MIEKIINGVKIHEWKYKNINGDDTGYNDLNKNVLNTFNCEEYNSLCSKEEKEEYINNIVKIMRDRGIYPLTYYYSHKDIIEEIQYCKEKELPIFDGNILDKRPTLGNLLLKFLFPNFHLIDCKGVKDNSLYARWLDNHKLFRSIEYCLNFKQKVKEPCLSYAIARGMEMIGGNTGNNYLPLKVRMLLEYYMPNGGNYFDFSCGFGGRLLGAMVSKSDINYYGFEPNSETFYHLNRLKGYIEEAFNLKEDKIHLYKQGSELELPEEMVENIDFAFSCPPYFNLEQYCDEETQCYIKYPTIEEWLDEYVKKTIINIYKALKPNALYAVNIADFKANNQQIKFVDEWINISEENGFELIKEIPVKMGKARPNNLSKKGAYTPKEECIYLFKKIVK